MTVWYAGQNENEMINTGCRVGTVFSPDDGHIVAQNMYRKAKNILRKFVHLVGSICKRLYKDAWSTKYTINMHL
jgi:hypothetical protein